MAELSNAVTVLIARMESHPEDFEMYGGDLYTKAKFGETAVALYGLVGLDVEKKNAYWFLNDADKEALIEAWKKYHRTRMEKEVMEKIFDDGQADREAEELKRRIYTQQMQVQQAQIQNQRMNAAQNRPGQFIPVSNAAQGSGNYYNGGGLLGSVKGFFG